MAAEHLLIQGRYHLGRMIGGGGMGSVYAGTDTLTGEPVAIKQLRVEVCGSIPGMVERFEREGDILRRLNHPNIVKVRATINEGDQHSIVMDFVGGGSLAELMSAQRPLALDRIVSLSLELSDALSRAHHLGVLHRDIKPANILLAEDGTPRLTDFGLARVSALPSLTDTGTILGTLKYSSPEALENRKIDERSDIWSFGVVLFEMITGRMPFEGESLFEMIWAIKNQPLPVIENLRKDIPPSLANLVRRMLRKDNPARIESMRQVGVELEAIQKELRARAGRQDIQERATLIRVLIADDHAVVRQGLRMFIDLQDDMEVVGEGTDGVEAVELAEKYHPDIALLDLVMPRMDGVEATARIKEICPDTRVMILTSFGEDDKVFPALRAGAQGYLLKDIQPNELVKAVREAYQGKTQLHPDIIQKLMLMVGGHSPSSENLPPEKSDSD
jgi:DNA-binding NarL/FixJ family response regulator